jgi:FixJ family two-component response regulator
MTGKERPGNRTVLYQRATAVFLVGSGMSPRPIDPVVVDGVMSSRCKDGHFFPMEPLIAIVDDDEAVGNALQRMLKSHGFATEVFASAEQFLRAPEPRSASCLIFDVRMPGMTGLALHDYLFGTGCRIPTILITACPTRGERRRAIASGVASYLAKPVSEDILLDTIREALEDGRPAEGEASAAGPIHT